MAEARGPLQDFDFGPEREAWEAVFDDATMMRVNALLMRLGANARSDRRREFFEAVVPELPAVGVRPLDEIVGDVAAARARLAREVARLEAESPAA
jgi:N-methylhydantoinase B